MKEWEGVAKNVSFGDLPNLDYIPRILDQILLGEDRSLGLTRRPRGVDEESRSCRFPPGEDVQKREDGNNFSSEKGILY